MSRARLTMSKKEFRPRPIDVNQPLPIISDEKILEEIDKETLHTTSPIIRPKIKTPKNKQIAVATPLYREVTDKATTRFNRPQNYIVYNDEDQEEHTELGDELEYELDHSDEMFLAALNERIKTRFAQSRQLRARSNNIPSNNTSSNNNNNNNSSNNNKTVKNRREKVNATIDITDDMLEQLIDGLEKEAFFVYGLRQMKDNTMDGMLCCVCNDHEGDDGNVLVLCDGCNMAAHQHCYGIQELPAATWLCARCTRRESNAMCVLCGGRYGGMRPTAEGQWAHVLCALWFPEISCKDESMGDPFVGIDKIHTDRWHKKCVLCNDTRGVCITCNEDGCKTQFHVGCARTQGLFLEARAEGEDESVTLTAYCPHHSLHHLDHYPAFPRDPEHSLGNDTALIAKSMGLTEEDYDLIYSYWRVKRRSHPPPLLKRLRAITTEGRSVRITCRRHMEDEHLRFVRLRQDFERARMLVDLVRKRELAKRQLLDSLQSLILFHTGEQSEDEEKEGGEDEGKPRRDTFHIHKRIRHKA